MKIVINRPWKGSVRMIFLLRNKGSLIDPPHPPGVSEHDAMLTAYQYSLENYYFFVSMGRVTLGLTLKISCLYTAYRPFQKGDCTAFLSGVARLNQLRETLRCSVVVIVPASLLM